MLASTVLLEMSVEGRDGRFDVRDFTQANTARPWSWLYPVGLVCAWFLSPDGQERYDFDDDEDFDGTAPPAGIRDFGVAIYFRGWDATKPLTSSYGELECPEMDATPARYSSLTRLAPYLSCD
jgi:hypothetical protein